MDAKTPTLGSLIDKLNDIRDKKRKAQEVVDELGEQYKELEASILQRLEAEGMDKGTGKKATVSRGEAVVANVVDWDAFYTFIYKNKFGHLLQRRVSEPAFRELLEMKGEKAMAKAGVTPFVKVSLNLRSISK